MKYLIACCALAVFAMAGAVAFRAGPGVPPGGATGRVTTASRGEAVELAPHVAGPGHVAVLFHADW